MPYSVPKNIDPNKIFLVNFSELEGRLDPIYYASNFLHRFTQSHSVKLKDVCVSFSSGFGAGKDEQTDEKNGYIQIRPTNIDNNGELVFDKNVFVPLQKTVGFVEKRTVLFNNTNSQELVGKTAILLEERELYTSNHITSIVVDETKANAEYIWIILNVYQRNKIFFSLCTNWNNQSGIGLDLLQSLKIPVPPLHIQQQIVNVYNAALSQRKKKLSESKAKLASIDQYLLGELGITLPEDSHEKTFIVNYKDVDGGRLDPKSYCNNVKNLKNAITDSSFEKQPLSTFIVNESSGDWGEDIERKDLDFANYTKCLVLRATEFDNRYNLKLDNSRVKYRYISNAKLRRMNIQTNDLIIEKSGGSEDQPVGRIGILTQEILGNNTIAFSNFLHKITVTGINPQYLFFYLKTMHNIGLTDSMQSQTNGIRNLIMSEYKRQNIIVPDKQTQTKIADHISAIRAEAKALEQEADAILEQAKKKVEEMILG